ncbi:MAG: DNA mismatch repair endonuclease MutL [Eubacterium sp.]|nr:DNA mismatch repair endonuclease MutL [Clostridia bacterium]MCI9421048.1 DNA mismatch repair endonuclease MutL [Eubacterium sp.]
MGNIVLLDELTINKIAAGEVIERPASVIKEMVENSIDAGATNITVEIKNGGISYIKVTDNGKGIAQDDLEIAFERHATSKIRTADDLSLVTSMGFRGEALASISAISKVEMISKTATQETGYRIVVEGGDVLEKEEIGCQTGTSITVRNLFYNTPVRYKFLKKDYTESGYIEDAITRIALVNPTIAIKLINTGKTVIQTNGNGDLKSVIYNIYGKDVANGIADLNYQYEDITISGVIGKPEIARSNRSNQLFFVNKRYIKDKTLTAATEQAYKGLIPIGKFGFVILNIEMNPAKVDVNVHPAKLEVRFEEENKIFQSIYHAIKDTLLKNELVVSTGSAREVSFEERLKNIREAKKENTNNGLFGFRKQNEKKIETYTEEESNIKTNTIEEISEEPKVEKATTQNELPKLGAPIDTSDVLKQLKEMKEKIVKELEEKNIKPAIELQEEGTEYKLEAQEEPKQENKIAEEKQEEQEALDLVEEELSETSQDTKKEEQQEELENSDPKEEQDKPKEENEINQSETIEEPENEKEETNQEKAEEVIETIDDPEIQKEFEEIKQKMQDLNDNPQVVTKNFNEMYAKMFGRLPIETEKELEEKEKEEEQKTSAVDLIKDNISVFDNIEHVQKPSYQFVGVVFKTYIILEIDKEMYILDQHAAHERIMYEKVKKNYYNTQNKDSQMLLLPDIITLSHKEMAIAKENMAMFEQAGFSLEEFGENTVKLNGVPTVCVELNTKELFLETLDEINTVARTAKQEKEEKFIATVACKAAVKANMALDKKEVESLMDKLLELPNPFTCPHGRPTVIKMTKYDIERKFARK